MTKVLTYKQARNYINDGDIIFIRDNSKFLQNPIRSAIRFFTNSNYVHTGIAFWATIAGHEHLMITEAQGGTSRRIVNLSFYQTEDIDVITPLRSWTTISNAAIAKLGKVEYGWLDAIYIGITSKLKFLHMKPRNFRGEICSEWVANLQSIYPSTVSPQQLFDILLQNHQRVKLRIRSVIP